MPPKPAPAKQPAPAVLPKQNGDGHAKKEGGEAEKSEEAIDAAVKKFKSISDSLGGHEQAKSFFATYGTDGFKPAKPEGEKELIKPKELTLDSDIKDYSDRRLGRPTRPEGFGAAYIDDPKWEIEEPSKLSLASDLSADDWQAMISSTKMLHGYVLNKSSGLSRARFQAFQLKPPAGKSYTDGAAIMPDYEVFDASSISIKETQSQTEKSMAQNGFSSEAISASIGVSTPYVGVGASTTVQKETQDSKSSADFSNQREFTATYNFPRARVFLDELNLEVTTECANHLVEIQKAAARIKQNVDAKKQPDAGNAVYRATRLVSQFYQKFDEGHIFACTVQLGGQLTSTKTASSFGKIKEEEKRDAMQAAVAASVETKFVSVSGGYSKGRSNDTVTNDTNTNSSSALAWNARGGNTLLCANPAAWADSVADHAHWRVMEQNDIYALPELIGKLLRPLNEQLAWPDISQIFETIAQNEYNQIPDVQPGTWTGKLRFETLENDKKVIIKDGELCVVNGKPTEGTIFNVLDADMKRRGENLPHMSKLYADHPLFIIPTEIPSARQSQADGAQFVGLSVNGSDNSGKITTGKVCRWSLRPARMIPAKNTIIPAPWRPNGTDVINGEEVALYCHSYHAGGSFTFADTPPLYAPPVMKKPDSSALRVFKLTQDWLDKADVANKEIREHPDWAFMNHDRTTIQSLIERSDVGQTNESDEAQLKVYRKLFGLKDNANWTAEHELLINPLLKMGYRKEDVKPLVPVALEKGMFISQTSWALENGFTMEQTVGPTKVKVPSLEVMRLRVRFC